MNCASRLVSQEPTNRLLADPFVGETFALAVLKRALVDSTANRKGSCRPAGQWCSLNPFMELGPARVVPIIGGVRRHKAAGYDPVYEIDHWRLDHAARLRFHNLKS